MQTTTGPAAAGSLAARLGAAALAALLLTGAASPSATPPAGLYGKGDPTADGVWRQSLALTALSAGQVVPADSAVSWLTGQQCADGGWTAYRADPNVPCEATAEDSNATAVAVQALARLGGHEEALAKATGWLRDTQNADGSWPLHPGRPGDAASTGLAVNALLAAGTDPATVSGKAGKNGYDGLALFQLGCAAPAEQRGAFSKAGASADVPTTASALLAAAGGRLPVTNTDRADAAPKPLTCPSGSAAVPHADSGEAASAYLNAQLAAGGQHLAHSDTTPDYAATAWAVLGLIQAGHPHQAASAADWLGGNAYTWAAKGPSGTDASATALLLLTAQAAQLDPYNFGGTNILQLLVDAGPAPKSVPSSATSALAENPDGTKAPGSGITEADDNGGFSPIWLIGIGLLVGIGGGLLLRLGRRRTAAS
ncbi:prenyltransferase/squalene oxidase repeat-containing protein [Kitasatospora sp. NPDC002227]|uniref:prenyltransferase/squalene oxidase repeat-containing protein n=1 Tax=Kitasatospora sp. NPDC002227 TaxID=3154773 RepID=UPI0033219C87